MTAPARRERRPQAGKPGRRRICPARTQRLSPRPASTGPRRSLPTIGVAAHPTAGNRTGGLRPAAPMSVHVHGPRVTQAAAVPCQPGGQGRRKGRSLSRFCLSLRSWRGRLPPNAVCLTPGDRRAGCAGQPGGRSGFRVARAGWQEQSRLRDRRSAPFSERHADAE
jgi:hypothetical protein